MASIGRTNVAVIDESNVGDPNLETVSKAEGVTAATHVPLDMEDVTVKPFESKAISGAGDIEVVEEGAILKGGGKEENIALDSPRDLPKTTSAGEKHSAGSLESAVTPLDLSMTPVIVGTIIADNKRQVSGVNSQSSMVVEIQVPKSASSVVEVPALSRPSQNIPPHLRPDFQLPVPRQYWKPDSHVSHISYIHDIANSVQHAMTASGGSRSTDLNRFQRQDRPTYQSNTHRHDDGRDQITRLNAQIMKVKNELESECRKNVHMRKMIETELQKKMEAGFSGMLANLLHDQAEALVLKATFEAKQQDLLNRENQIEQLEVFLAEGQKQLYFDLEDKGIRAMDSVDREHIRREAELMVEKSYTDIEGKLKLQMECLGLREAAQEMREQQYKVLIRTSVESEVHDNMLSQEKADEIAELEYNRGYGAGREIGCKDSDEKSKKMGFLEGYAACHRTQTALDNVRHGRIARDNPELDFLFDTGHPDNMFNRGMQIGKLSLGVNAKPVLDGDASATLTKATSANAMPNGGMHVKEVMINVQEVLVNKSVQEQELLEQVEQPEELEQQEQPARK